MFNGRHFDAVHTTWGKPLEHTHRTCASYSVQFLHVQGRPDYALASAGGSVVGHSMLALEGRPRWVPPLQRAAHLLSSGLLSFVHPHADEVG